MFSNIVWVDRLVKNKVVSSVTTAEQWIWCLFWRYRLEDTWYLWSYFYYGIWNLISILFHFRPHLCKTTFFSLIKHMYWVRTRDPILKNNAFQKVNALKSYRPKHQPESYFFLNTLWCLKLCYCDIASFYLLTFFNSDWNHWEHSIHSIVHV